MVIVNIIIEKHESHYCRAMADRVTALRSLNSSRGLGRGSRIRRGTAAAELPEGWRIERQSSKCNVWYDEDGKRYRSSIAVQKELKKRRILTDYGRLGIANNSNAYPFSRNAASSCNTAVLRASLLAAIASLSVRVRAKESQENKAWNTVPSH